MDFTQTSDYLFITESKVHSFYAHLKWLMYMCGVETVSANKVCKQYFSGTYLVEVVTKQ